MIDVFESTARSRSDRVFLSFVDASGNEAAYTYRHVRLGAAAIARHMRQHGVRPGDFVVVDLPNTPAFAFLALAAAYGSFSLVALNHRLSESEKLTRLLELEREGLHVADTVDEARADVLLRRMRATFEVGGTVAAAGRPRGFDRRSRTIMGARQDAVEDTVHFAERSAHLFDPDATAIVMFTSGTTGRPKAVPLTWRQLTSAAEASNRSLGSAGSVLWQAVLPFYHIGGFQVLVRSIVGRTPLRLYERFDAERVLADAETWHATHISVVDKMLQDMLAAEDARGTGAGAVASAGAGAAASAGAVGRAGTAAAAGAGARTAASARGVSRLAGYRCILLGGGALNPQTVDRAFAEKARVYASYGMTETSSHIANTLITPQFTGGLKLMEGYAARIVDPDAQGFGRLAVRGPGVFDDYLNARAAFTVDGFFLTGDTAALYQGCIYVKERTSDMFVSGGENVYPAEIADVLRRVPGVADAHVFGVADATWGRRPVAVVERARRELQASDVRRAVAGKLSKLNMPEALLVTDELPRTGIGKVDRAATEALYEHRLEVRRVVLHHIRLPFKRPFRTAQAALDHRDVVIVEVVDHAGHVGLGECVSFETDWYLPETLGDDERIIESTLAPALIGQSFAHARDVAGFLAKLPGASSHPMAACALESALWDLQGHVAKQPLWQLLGEEYARLAGGAEANTAGVGASAAGAADGARASGASGVRVGAASMQAGAQVHGSAAFAPAGAVVGVGAPVDVVAAVREAVNDGYRRVKLKIAPDQGLAAVRAIRKAYPGLLVTLDANQSFAECNLDELRAFDDLGVGWIEEPLAAHGVGAEARADVRERLAALQRTMRTPLCVDESFVNAEEAERVLEHSELRCIAVKVAKFGGIEPALRFVARAQSLGRRVWMGGMYDTGVSKRLHAAFETLPGVATPGDIGATSRYFATDVTDPPYVATRGYIMLNAPGRENGLGCSLNLAALNRALVKRTAIGGGQTR